MKENNENKAKALEENKKNYSSENSTPEYMINTYHYK
jgi:hypothetical protein